jgi:hypothetical protein
MAGRMNWSRAAKEAGVQRYGSERLAARDRSLPRETQADRDAIAAKKRRHIGPRIPPEEQAARAAKNAEARVRNRAKAQETELKQAEMKAKKLAHAERVRKEKAEERERLAKNSAEFEARLMRMSPEERIAFERSQSHRFYRKQKPVIVEHAPLKPKRKTPSPKLASLPKKDPGSP